MHITYRRYLTDWAVNNDAQHSTTFFATNSWGTPRKVSFCPAHERSAPSSKTPDDLTANLILFRFSSPNTVSIRWDIKVEILFSASLDFILFITLEEKKWRQFQMRNNIEICIPFISCLLSCFTPQEAAQFL